MTIEQKMGCIKAFLKRNNIKFKENWHCEKCGALIPLRVAELRIAIYGGESQEFYEMVKRRYAPLFVREEESMEFIMEKLQNLIIKRMKTLHWIHSRKWRI